MLTIEPAPPPPQQPQVDIPDKYFDWSGRLSMEMIRLHTKTDDTPGVTDEQLRLYRDASIEAAEHYTGMMLAGSKMVTEPVSLPTYQDSAYRNRNFYRHTLRYPIAADGSAFVYGVTNQRIPVTAGARSVRIPLYGVLDLTNCCNPCAQQGQAMIMYQAGFTCPDDVPAGVVVGCLQFIAWLIEHPGDELLTMRNRLDARGGAGVYGTNSIAMASGAIETWRVYDDEAI